MSATSTIYDPPGRYMWVFDIASTGQIYWSYQWVVLK